MILSLHFIINKKWRNYNHPFCLRQRYHHSTLDSSDGMYLLLFSMLLNLKRYNVLIVQTFDNELLSNDTIVVFFHKSEMAQL